MNENTRFCGHCNKPFEMADLYWVNDNYGIPYKCVCDDCYDEVEVEIRGNDYGKYLTHDELYGED